MTNVKYSSHAESKEIEQKLRELGINGSYCNGNTHCDITFEDSNADILDKLLKCKNILDEFDTELIIQKPEDSDAKIIIDFKKLAEVSVLIKTITLKKLKTLKFIKASEDIITINSPLFIKDCNIIGDVTLNNTSFKKELTFSAVNIKGSFILVDNYGDQSPVLSSTFSLDNTHIEGSLLLNNTQFKSSVIITELAVSGLNLIEKNTFSENFILTNSHFSHDFKLENNQFKGDKFEIRESNFQGKTNFNEVKFKNSEIKLEGVQFSNAVIFKNISTNREFLFKGVEFFSDFKIEKVELCQILNFTKTTFNELFRLEFNDLGPKLIFEKSTLEDDFIFKANIVDKECNFIDTTFKKNVVFDNTTFKENVKFNNSTFTSKENLYTDIFLNNTFEKTVSFNNATFFSNMNYTETKFKSDVSFMGTIFNEETNFSGIEFLGNISFLDTSFKKKVLFDGVKFFETATFENTSFDSFVYFGKTEFHRYNSFFRVSFSDVASFEKSIFHENIRFITNKYDPLKSLLIFRYTDFKKAFDFSCDNFRGQQIFYNIETIKKKELFKLLSSTSEKDAENDEITYARFRSTCCIIKDIYAKTNNKLDRFDFHKLEMSAYRKEKNKDKILLFFNYVSNVHGTNWPIGLLFTFITGSIFFILHNLLTFTGSFDFFCWANWGETTSAFLNFINPLRGLNDPVWEIENPSNWGNVIDFLAKIIVGYGIYQMIQAFRKFGKN